MAFPLLPRWNLQPNRPSFYDTDSATLLELASKMHGSFNEMVTDYNNLVVSVENQMNQFMEDANADREAFATALRQEFQDFIDIVSIKLENADRLIDEMIVDVKTGIKEAIETGKITIGTVYDSDTEALNIGVTGGVNIE